MLATLLSAFETFPARRVIAAITASVMTARTTPYSAIVCPSSRRMNEKSFCMVYLPSVTREAEPHRPPCTFGECIGGWERLLIPRRSGSRPDRSERTTSTKRRHRQAPARRAPIVWNSPPAKISIGLGRAPRAPSFPPTYPGDRTVGQPTPLSPDWQVRGSPPPPSLGASGRL